MMPNNSLQPTAISPLRGSTSSLAALGAYERGRSAECICRIAAMYHCSDSDRLLALLLQCVGGIAILAVVPLWMPPQWIEGAHQWLGLGEFPISPIAE